MATRRNLKKDIEYITYTVVHDCMSYVDINPENNTDDVVKIITDMVSMRNDLFHRVNHQKKDTKKNVKTYYKSIYEDLLNTADQSFTQLSKIITK